ncbi:MAG: ChbG/HpnK family deacetylase [Fimbriimonadaceae bacterium]|nr:ChbG/HpnK family deacetylase [Fimbriimonadaceae bacterium]
MANGSRLIIRADDLGCCQAANEAILRCCTVGVATSAEVMVCCGWFPDALRRLEDVAPIDLGVHLTLTSEWEHLKWRPLTHCPSLVDPDGWFWPFLWEHRHYPGQALLLQPWRLEEVEGEFRAQIELALRRLSGVTHLSFHMGCNRLDDATSALVHRLASEYGLDRWPAAHGVQGVGYSGPKSMAAEQRASFLATIDSLAAGQTYLFVDHPALDTPETRALHHIGYSNVALDRQGVTDCWCDETVAARLAERGIELISYGDLPAGAHPAVR